MKIMKLDNTGPRKWHPGGLDCDFMRNKIALVAIFSEGDGIKSETLANFLRH